MPTTTPTVYRSTDASAPVLTGQAGSLINLLDKCLVSGYGSKVAAGWTKPFADVPNNLAVFRMGGGTQMFMDVNDNGPGVGSFREARLRGYETMTAVATGTAAFPTVGQLATAIICRKSSTLDATARLWTLVADNRTFHLLNKTGDVSTEWRSLTFGDFFSYLAGTDLYRTMIMAYYSEAVTSPPGGQVDALANYNSPSMNGHYLARAYNGLGGSFQFVKGGDQTKAGTGQTSLVGALAAPNPADGNVWIAPVSIYDPNVCFRGRIRGFMHYLHTAASCADQDTVAGAGVYAGHTFLLFKTLTNGGIYCIDITGPWDAN